MKCRLVVFTQVESVSSRPPPHPPPTGTQSILGCLPGHYIRMPCVLLRGAVCTVESFICLSDTEDRMRTVTGSADLQHLVWVRAVQSTPSHRNPPGEKDVSSSIPLRYPPLIFWSAIKLSQRSQRDRNVVLRTFHPTSKGSLNTNSQKEDRG